MPKVTVCCILKIGIHAIFDTLGLLKKKNSRKIRKGGVCLFKRIFSNVWIKRLILIAMDIVAVSAAYYLASFFSEGGFAIKPILIHPRLYIFLTAVTISVFYVSKFYSSVLRYAGAEDFMRLIVGISAATAVVVFLEALTFRKMTAEQFLVAWALQLIFVLSPRMVYRFVRSAIRIRKGSTGVKRRVLIIGAGECGVQVMRNLSAGGATKVCAFIDDDAAKQKNAIDGVQVIGGRGKIADAVKKHRIDIIVLAIPTLDGKGKKEIITKLVKENSLRRFVP